MARASQTTIRPGTQHLPKLDRSRSRLRLPNDILPEAMRQASGEGLASPLAAVRLETGGVIVDDELDPAAADMLRVMASASMMVAVDVQHRGDASVTTIWATPSRAVVTSNLDTDLVDIEPVRLLRLPETLSDIILLGRPEVIPDRVITVPAAVMAEAERLRLTPDRARAVLAGGGLDERDVEQVFTLQSPTVRRWRISSTWATDGGPRMAELRGVDAGSHGQWLVELRGSPEEGEAFTFTPQGDGDVLRALRDVLPRQWVGTALNRRSVS